MKVHRVTPVLNVSSFERSLAWFEKLGWTKGFDWLEDPGEPATFGSVRWGETEIFLCVDGQGSRGTIMPEFPGDDRTDGVWMMWWVDGPAAVDALYEAAMKQGFTVTYPPTDEPWNTREFHLRHPDGHMFRVSAGLPEA